MKKVNAVLGNCLLAFNKIPNTKVTADLRTYEVATQIEDVLKDVKTLQDNNTILSAILQLMVLRDSYRPSTAGYMSTNKIIKELEQFNNQ